MNHRIFVVGSCNTDMVVRSRCLPVPGETILGGKFLMNSGGKGANQAVAAARLGGDVTFVARVGNDLFGEKAVEQYKKEGINTSYITVDPEQPSGVALIMVDAKGENSISVAASANDTLMPKHVKMVEDLFSAGDIVLMQLESPIQTVEYTAAVAAAKGLKVVLNPAPACELPASLLQNVYMIIPNECEAEILSGIKVTDFESARLASAIIASKGVDIVLITMGKQGAFVREGNRCSLVPSFPVKAVDTTAAGDTFCGALCVALSEGLSVKEAALFGNRAASVSVTREGAQASIPTRAEIDALVSHAPCTANIAELVS